MELIVGSSETSEKGKVLNVIKTVINYDVPLSPTRKKIKIFPFWLLADSEWSSFGVLKITDTEIIPNEMRWIEFQKRLFNLWDPSPWIDSYIQYDSLKSILCNNNILYVYDYMYIQ